jgi:hypothetical protein
LKQASEQVASEQLPFVTFADLMAKVAYFLFPWSLLEQGLTSSIETARARLSLTPLTFLGTLSERLDSWLELTMRLPENAEQRETAVAVRDQAPALKRVRNLIVHGLQAGDSDPDDGPGYIRCSVGGYAQSTGETVCYTIQELEHYTHGMDACRRGFGSLRNFNYTI